MKMIRSVLWVGSGRGAGCGLLADAAAFDVAWARDVDDALELPLAAFDAVVVDLNGDSHALDSVRRLRAACTGVPVVVRTDADDVAFRAQAEAAGAAALLPGEADSAERTSDRLLRTLELLAAPERARPSDSVPTSLETIVADSPAMRGVIELARRAAGTHTPVLVTGETGTGKELLARAIHRGSPDRSRSFVAVNCAAFPEPLLESELFGHVRGAFTGADREKKGLFAVADGGTLFLDEVAEMSPALQAKLLRALQEHEIRPVGGTRTRRVDARVVAATNRNLQHEVTKGRFREDLYYRLAVFPIEIPPLRERPEDVLPLAETLLRRHARREGKNACRLAEATRRLLSLHDWPGNVRELENELQRALALADDGQELGPDLFSARLTSAGRLIESAVREHEPLRRSLDRVEAWLIRRALESNDGRRARTARQLGITREGLYKKMKRLGIE